MANKTFLQEYKQNVKATVLAIANAVKALTAFGLGCILLMSLFYGTGWLYSKEYYVFFATALVGWLLAAVAFVTYLSRQPASKPEPNQFDID